MKLGIIGGSGLENPEIIKNSRELKLKTKYGKPSSSILSGNIGDNEVFILSRHGREHTIPPTQVNNRANIHVLKQLEVEAIFATTAAGSLKEEIGRGDLVILDQFIDFTRHREITFHTEFKPGKMQHTPMAEPFNETLRNHLIESCQSLDIKNHRTGTIITIEGPRFSTRAESNMFRKWGAELINMSTAPECILANEAGIPYAAIAMSTDYDSWKTDEIPVSWEAVLEVFNQNVEKVTKLLVSTIENFDLNLPY